MAILVKPRKNVQGIVDTVADLAGLSGRNNYEVLVKDYGVFEWIPTSTTNGTTIFAGTSGFWSIITSSAPESSVSVKVYRALVTQSSTTAPTATVLENSLGGTLVWARSVAGTYTATLAGTFTSAKTFIMQPGETGTIAAIKNVLAVRTSADVVTVTTGSGGTLEDGVLSSYPISILVYP